MSQASSFINSNFPPGSVVETLQGNSGGPVSPTAGFNIFVVGDGTTIDVVGNPGTNTLTASFIGSTDISITGDTGGALVGNAFTFTGGTTGLSFGGAGTTQTLTFAGITANGGTVSLATDATTSTLNIGTGAGPKTVALGSINTTSGLTLNSGSGGIKALGVASVAVSNKNYVTINTSTGALGSDNSPLTSISITGDTGGALTGSSFTFAGGSTGLSFGGSGTTQTLTFAGITANGGTVNLATDATSSSINVGTGAGAKTTTFGSTNTTSTTVIQSGTGSITCNSGLTIDSTGRNTNTAQPAFLAYLGAQVDNVTGNGNIFTLGTTTALTEVFDQGNNFNTNGTFTAPVTGKYFISAAALVVGCTVASNFNLRFVSSNRSFLFQTSRTASSANLGYNGSALVDMDAADTLTVTIEVAGEAGNTCDVFGAGAPISFISGNLTC